MSFPDQPRKINTRSLGQFLVQFYPAAIRTAEQQKGFNKFRGSLELRSAGSDQQNRYAVLSGSFQLIGNRDSNSKLDGLLEAVLTNDRESPVPRSLRRVIQGTFQHTVQGRKAGEIALTGAFESLPD